tara:strand:+ start:2685 stop:2873 length:189 start_codon:yes stop_codon:yes gene_type:complete
MKITKKDNLLVLKHYNSKIRKDDSIYDIKAKANELIENELCKPIIGKKLRYKIKRPKIRFNN